MEVMPRPIARGAQRTNKTSQFMDVFRCLSAGAVAKRKTTEFTAAREAAWYRHHTHLVIEMWEGTVGGRGGSRNRAPGWPCHGSGSRLRDLFSRGRCADKFEILDCHQTAINSPKSKQICRQTDSPARSGHPIDFVRQSEGTFSCVGHNFDYESR